MMSGSLLYQTPPNALETRSLTKPKARLAAAGKAQKFLSQPANRVSAGVSVAMPSLLYGC